FNMERLYCPSSSSIGVPMRRRQALWYRTTSVVLHSECAVAVFSCSGDSVGAPRVGTDGLAPATAKSTTALTVSSVSPPFGDQGTTVNIHVFGSGFASD